jgi:UMF1 family MFS transporter
MADEMARERPGLRKSQLAYGLFDWASSPVPTLHATFVFAVYYVSSVSPEHGSAQWAWMNALAAITVALLSPFLGAGADARASRKRWLLAMTFLGVMATAMLWWIRPEPAWIWPALALSYLSIVAMESQFTFYNALLPSVSTPSTIGRVSGFSWAAGYLGAIVCLVLVLTLFILPETPALGLHKDSAEHVRVTMPFVAVWFLVFAIPLFLWVDEGPAAEGHPGVMATLLEGLRTARSVPGLIRFLIARMIYGDGLVVVFAFGGIYATNVFGFTQHDVIVFAIAINITSGVGAAFIGWLEDQIGGFNTVRLSLVCLFVLAAIVLLSPTRLCFWIAALTLGFFIGPVQSASRTVVARLVPPTQRARIFGLYTISGKATSFAGPLLYGTLVTAFGTDRAGMSVAVAFFLISLVILGRTAPGEETAETCG